MLKFLITLFAVVTASCFSATEVPTPLAEPAAPKILVDSPQETSLSHDEVKYIKTMFRTAVINDCLTVFTVTETDKNSGALTRITHPVNNQVGQLIVARCFKDADGFDKELFTNVYKDADARNKVRIWDIQGEVNFLRSKIDSKIKEDPKFADDLLTAFKDTQKAAAEPPKGK